MATNTHGVVRRGMSGVGAYLSQETDYAKIMDGLGGYGERVTDHEQIRPSLPPRRGDRPRRGLRGHGR